MKNISITTRRAWTKSECSKLVTLYKKFLISETAGVKYVKAPAVRDLMEKLDRTKGSIECALMNISAVLKGMNKKYVDGYKPLSGYSKTLEKVVKAKF